jgi:hypothetical protein
VNRNQFRQGDVMIERIGDVAELPEGLVPVARDRGRVVLAWGEISGHAHAIADPNAELVERPGTGERWLIVRAGAPTLRTIRIQPDYTPPCAVVEGPVRLADHAGLVQIVVRTGGAILEHEEHGAIVLDRPGVYKLPGQREWSPEAIRNVAD